MNKLLKFVRYFCMLARYKTEYTKINLKKHKIKFKYIYNAKIIKYLGLNITKSYNKFMMRIIKLLKDQEDLNIDHVCG